ncbi:MAG: glycoside hydrolase family 10 protein, partial [Candidatus Limnocylindria bacterium]
MRKIVLLALVLVLSPSLGRAPGAEASDPLLEPAGALGADATAAGRAEPEPRAQAAAALGPQQLRAYWVDAFGEGFYNEAQIDQLIADVKSANLNAIVAQVVRRGDCFCNDSSLPRTEAGVAARPFDPLRSLIAKAHAQGIEVHAWIIATGLWRGTTPPRDASHAFNAHGTAASGSDYWLTKRSDGADRLETEYHLDPGHPDAADYVVRMATSIVEAYDVDGINLDRIRYPDGNIGGAPSWGYNPTAVARFQAATGRGDVPAPTDPEWTQWRRDRVTDIVRRIYVETYRIRPSVRISVDTIVYGYGPQSTGGWTNTRTYRELLQDWVGWMREGIVDLNVPMNYKRDSSADQRRMFQEWSDYAKEQQYGRAAAIGTALYLNDIAGSVRQVRTSVAPGGDRASAGWVGYAWRNPDDLAAASARSGALGRAELDRALTEWSHYDPGRAPVFAEPASVPAMPWKETPTTGLLRGTAPAPYAPVQVRNSGGALVRSGLTDGSSWFGFVDLAPGTYTVTAAGKTYGAVVEPGRVASTSEAGTVACTSTNSVGPGIPPPATVPSGLPGFHAAWYGQSGYPTLCPGERSIATVAYYNSGSLGWVAGKMGQVAY